MQMVNMLPSSLQSRFRVLNLGSLRRSASLRRSRSTSIHSIYSESASTNPSVESVVISDAESDVTEASTSTATTARSSVDYNFKHQQFETSLTTVMEERRLPKTFVASSYDAGWSPSGIKWRYARQGAHLTSQASEDRTDPAFERRSYIDGVAYFLKACPDNLTELETDIFIRSAPWLASRPPSRGGFGGFPSRPTDRGRTFLHRIVQHAVATFVVIAHAVWCFLLLVGRVGARYERQYNISQHLISHGYVVANAIGKHSVVLSGRIYAMSDGRVGQLVSAFAAWTVDSFTGGIQDGYGDGIVMIRGQPQLNRFD